MKKKTIAFVVANATANLSRIRWENRKVFGGSIADEKPGATAEQTLYEVLPYQYGLLRAYIEQYADDPGRYRFLPPCFQSLSVEETAQKCAGADLVGYSVYIWNERFNLAVARRVREINPGAVNCFGGPQVPMNAEAFLRAHPQVDLACFGEGEQAFFRVAEHLDDRDWSECPGISWLDAAGNCRNTPPCFLSNRELADCRSPYDTGIFDGLMSEHSNKNWLMLLETNRGCPFTCAYCGWGAGHSERRVRRFSMARVKNDLEWAGRREIEQILVCDSNFGLLPRDLDITDAIVEVAGRTGAFNAVSVQSTCAFRDRVFGVHQKLADAGLSSGATVGLQSRSRKVLALCRRRFVSRKELDGVLNRYARLGVDTYCDVILGLPGETYDSFTSGIAELIASGQYNNLFVYPFTPLINTAMGKTDFQRAHGIRTVRQPMVGTHMPVSDGPEAVEYSPVVAATADMPAADWRRAKVYLWLVQTLFFCKLLQVPMLLGIKLLSMDIRTMAEAFMGADPAQYPVTAGLVRRFHGKARDIQEKGAAEMTAALRFRDAWWPVEQFALIQLVREEKLEAFYGEAADLLVRLVPEGAAAERDRRLITQSVGLNRSLFRVPFVTGNVRFTSDFNLKALYRGIIRGHAPILVEGRFVHEIIRTRPEWKTWEGWYDHLMFCHNQKKYYLYGFRLATEARLQQQDTGRAAGNGPTPPTRLNDSSRTGVKATAVAVRRQKRKVHA